MTDKGQPSLQWGFATDSLKQDMQSAATKRQKDSSHVLRLVQTCGQRADQGYVSETQAGPDAAQQTDKLLHPCGALRRSTEQTGLDFVKVSTRQMQSNSCVK